MALFRRKKKGPAISSVVQVEQPTFSDADSSMAVTSISEKFLSDAARGIDKLITLLRENGIEVIDDWSALEPEHRFGYRAMLFPYIRIETTQIFSNPVCAMTYLCRQWRDSPFAPGDLSHIDISISDQNAVCISAQSPYGALSNGADLAQVLEQMKSLLPQCKLQSFGLGCDSIESIPYLWGIIEPNGTDPFPTEVLFDLLQFMALDVHLVFSSISSSLRNPYKLPRLASEVLFTPDVQDAQGGYFVYGLDGSLWWLVDANFKFISVVGRHIWQEFLDAEEMGKPLTFADMDNLYYYENGMLYQSDGVLKGRYCHERLT